jgi:hypothetical protein
MRSLLEQPTPGKVPLPHLRAAITLLITVVCDPLSMKEMLVRVVMSGAVNMTRPKIPVMIKANVPIPLIVFIMMFQDLWNEIASQTRDVTLLLNV